MIQESPLQENQRQKVLSKSIIRTAGTLGLSNAKLAAIIGLSPSTITRLGKGTYLLNEGKKEWEFGTLFIRLFRSLDSITGGNDEASRTWLESANSALAGQKPVDLIATTEGLIHVVTYLDAKRGII